MEIDVFVGVREAIMRTSLGLIAVGSLVTCLSNATEGQFQLLEPHSATRVEGTEQFVAAEAFKIGNRIGSRTLSAVGWNFADHFLAVVEQAVPPTTVKGWTLLYTAGDKSLIDRLGDQEKAAVPYLAYIHRVMAMGENGPNHVDSKSNFAYMWSPIDQRLWAVHWTVNYTNEWNVGAVYVPHPDLHWPSGSRLFGG